MPARKMKSGAGIVAQDVETDRQFDCPAHFAPGNSHCRDRFGTNAAFREWNIAEVFDEKRAGPAAGVSLRVSDGGVDNRIQTTIPLRRPGQRAEVDYADEEFRGSALLRWRHAGKL